MLRCMTKESPRQQQNLMIGTEFRSFRMTSFSSISTDRSNLLIEPVPTDLSNVTLVYHLTHIIIDIHIHCITMTCTH